MDGKKKRIFQRPLGERRYKKLFVVSVEGSKTEPQYFSILNHSQSVVQIKCLRRKSTASSPIQILQKIENYLRKESLRRTDEAWIVLDKDNWPEYQLQKVQQWTEKRTNYNFALSNPNFEFWLLLHFENGEGIINSKECLTRLKKHLPHYRKNINVTKITLEHINQAIIRARQKHTNRSNDLPQVGTTNVYKLVERILNCK